MLATQIPMDWQQLLSFLDDYTPGLAKKIHGASPSDIDALCRRSPIPFPKNYLEFLRHFGGEDGGFRVFPRHLYLAKELLVHTASAATSWNPSRHLLIGVMESRICEDPHDLFLDLPSGNAIDAPLIGMDPDPEEPNGESFSIACSLADRLIIQVAWRVVDKPNKASARLVAFGSESAGAKVDVQERYRKLVSVAAKLGYAPCVSPTANTWMGRQGPETFVLIRQSQAHDLAAMDLRGNDQILIAQTRETIEDLGLAESMSVLSD